MLLTLDQVDTYHEERGNSEWADITESTKHNHQYTSMKKNNKKYLQ